MKNWATFLISRLFSSLYNCRCVRIFPTENKFCISRKMCDFQRLASGLYSRHTNHSNLKSVKSRKWSNSFAFFRFSYVPHNSCGLINLSRPMSAIRRGVQCNRPLRTRLSSNDGGTSICSSRKGVSGIARRVSSFLLLRFRVYSTSKDREWYVPFLFFSWQNTGRYEHCKSATL